MASFADFSKWALLAFLLLLHNSSLSSLIKLDQPLTDGHTLSSPSATFQLGFFSPGNSTNRYAGIWQGEFSPSNVVWVANRDAPISDSTGSISVAGDGNLVIVDGRNRVLWSSKVPQFPSNDSVAELTDFGDLVLNNTGVTAWESFAHPTETYLAGMKVSYRLGPNSSQVLSSWKSPDDPSLGNFTLGVDPSSQLFIWDSDRPRWRSGEWNGQVFIGIPGMMFLAAYGFTLSNFIQGNSVYYYTEHNSAHRWVLTPAGTLKHLMYSKNSNSWLDLWEAPITECEKYNKCGSFGSCSNGMSPICSCLKGFVPRSSIEWSRGNWSGGCLRRTPLQCGSNVMVSGGSKSDQFYLMEGVKLPDLAEKITQREVVNVSACGEVCIRNCSCKAYSFVDAIGCMIWVVDLVDVNVFSSDGNDLFLRLAASEFGEGEEKKTLAVYIIVLIVLAAVCSLGCISFLLCKCRRRKEGFHWNRGSTEESTEFDDVIEMQDKGNDTESHELPLFSFTAIMSATGGFSEANFLGKGGFGSVYKGKLPGGQEIAVKRLSRGSRQGLEEFKNEVILIAKLQHRNLVRLLGFCTEKEDQMLVYEYMPNKSLDAFLFGNSKKGVLDWETRYSIIEGIARGLLYLHRDSRLRVIHRDLKASNILLDQEMNPKISDFGLARIFRNDNNETVTNRVVGTYGYMSPEYAMQGQFSVKSDVYSFGVLLLEIISGQRNKTYHSDVDLYLLAFAWRLWSEGHLMELVDPTIKNSFSMEEVSKCVNIALLCVQDRANERPTMASVVMMLESGVIAQSTPKQPTFAFQTNFNDIQTQSSDSRVSSNNVSITILTGR
ncbi:hypothetical protein HPP92_026538 [Vanilla planifolia]|uniref:Receptor-like serine/threonine-protein kinase n=1 Tax=Vanilla planifolia TaxID=51239 RepID=A0A835U7E8_VANPL|nr:hypothetical protein HPP92_026538 [Vanilla planifolia]